MNLTENQCGYENQTHRDVFCHFNVFYSVQTVKEGRQHLLRLLFGVATIRIDPQQMLTVIGPLDTMLYCHIR